MAKQTALPATLPPRLISREAAAAYVSVSPNIFDEMVKSRKMPQAKALTERRIAWDVRELDLFIDNLPSTNATAVIDATWGDVDAS
jgi:predicted DNA-binding transcriptional regulator AlpA